MSCRSSPLGGFGALLQVHSVNASVGNGSAQRKLCARTLEECEESCVPRPVVKQIPLALMFERVRRYFHRPKVLPDNFALER